MKKILICSTLISTIKVFLIPHIKLLKEMGYQVDIIGNKNTNYLDDIVDNTYNIPFQRNPLSKSNFIAAKELKKIIKKNNYKIVHFHTPVASAFGRIAIRNYRKSDLLVYYTAHGFHFYKGAPLKNWLIYYPIEKWLARYTDCLITINQEDYNVAVNKHFKTGNIKIIHGVGIDLERFKPQSIEKKYEIRKEYGYSERDFIITYVAELSYRKHQDLLINISKTLKSKIPNLKILLVGLGSYFEQYKNQIIDLGLEDQVMLLGYRNDISNLMLISDVAVSTSRQEGLPVNIMEAMATGLPLVVTDVRGNRDLVKDGLNGFVVELDNMKEFTNAVEEIYEDILLCKEFGKKSIELIQKYSLVNVLQELEILYNTPNRPV